MVLLHSSERTIFCGRIWRRKFLQNNTDNTPSIHEIDSIGETNTIDASEPIGYTLKNNYLFIALMNDSEYALTRNRRFISAFWTLHYLKIIPNSLHHIGC